MDFLEQSFGNLWSIFFIWAKNHINRLVHVGNCPYDDATRKQMKVKVLLQIGLTKERVESEKDQGGFWKKKENQTAE